MSHQSVERVGRQPTEQGEMSLLSLRDVSRLLDLDKRTVQAMVLTANVPFSTVGKAWAFDERAVRRLASIKEANARRREVLVGVNAS